MSRSENMKGNLNAQKEIYPAKANLNIRVRGDSLARWKAKAQEEGKTLTQWVVDRLNK